MIPNKNNNPNKRKGTQGHKKAIQYFRELFKNELFLGEVDKIKKISNSEKKSKEYWKLAEKYGLLIEPGEPLFDFLLGVDIDTHLFDNQYLDMCIIRDDVDEYLNDAFPRDHTLPPSQRPDKRAELLAYPIRIGINPKATKRDVLDFINKKWDEIRYMLDFYEENPSIIRNRPKAQRDEYIWNHRHLNSNKVAEMANTKFPNENLTYSDINKIVSRLKKRKKSALV